MLREAERDLAEQFATHYDAQPASPSIVSAGRSLVFSFHDGLSHSDERLIEAGQGNAVREFRERFLDAVSTQLIALLEATTGARVSSFFSSFDPVSRATVAVFVVVAR